MKSSLGPGDLFDGRYRIVREIGRGGMGVVFEAVQERIRRRVALKMISRDVSDDACRRFLREARAGARLTSRHAVQLFDIGAAEGTPYLVMEYLDGQSMATLHHARQFTDRDIVLHGSQALEAIGEAHTKGIIHRDLKPDNVMIARVARERVAKVVDFGIAKLLDEASATTRGPIGTPRYMSPEQILGDPISPATDIFSFAVLLYVIFANAYPFEATAEKSYLLAVASEPPVPLAERRPDLPRGIVDVVTASLAKAPTARPTATDLRQVLLQHREAPSNAESAPTRTLD
jgi:serine/threonine-protein kinase